MVRVNSVWNSLPSRDVEAGSVEFFNMRLDAAVGSNLLDTICVLIMVLCVFLLL